MIKNGIKRLVDGQDLERKAMHEIFAELDQLISVSSELGGAA